MSVLSRRVLLIAPLALVAACGRPERPPERLAHPGPAEINGLIAR